MPGPAQELENNFSIKSQSLTYVIEPFLLVKRKKVEG